ncbi:hypothetical protein B0H16DRAFT_1745743 [Mycena metata]|uniref:SWIM-type domain-containing protein n=1 Tax=Mycena metata TaxID=1033252 RepID=A0AAD7H246_9AGAR|nr:hypothetical protein B0H16DRAFT_1745743 [Mycena metata]
MHILAVLPDDIKYQLCFWHCIRAVKTRLSVLGRHPAHYDPDEAFKEFDWINRDFVPINQMDEGLRTEENLRVAQTAIATLKLRLTGQTSEVPAPARPKIIIHLNGRLEKTHSLGGDSDNALEDFVDSLDDDGKILTRTPMQSTGGMAPHQYSSLVKLLLQPPPPMCSVRHPIGNNFFESLLAISASTPCSLIAQATLAAPKRSDMTPCGRCINFASFNGDCGRSGATCGLLGTVQKGALSGAISNTKPSIILFILALINSSISSRSRPRKTPHTLPQSLQKLVARPLGTQVYIVNLVAWTCSCGQQKYNAFLLCKHLVQAFHLPHPDFFREVVRRRVTPFYGHRLLVPKDGSELNVINSGTVSDGDDDVVEATQASSSA